MLKEDISQEQIATKEHPDTVVSRCCGKRKVKTFEKVSSNGRSIWINEFGERWYGAKCPECYKKYKLKYDEKRRIKLGYRPLGSIYNCDICQVPFLVTLGLNKACPECQAKLIQDKLKRN